MATERCWLPVAGQKSASLHPFSGSGQKPRAYLFSLFSHFSVQKHENRAKRFAFFSLLPAAASLTRKLLN
jgi:hypothetical protein